MKSIKEITLRSKDNYHYNGKKIPLHSTNGFVHFVGLVKAVCKNDHEGVNSTRFWNRLKPTVEKKDYLFVDEDLYVSPTVVKKLTNDNAVRCEKTWGCFQKDGLQFIMEDLKQLKRGSLRSPPSSAGAGPSSSKKQKQIVVPCDKGGDIVFENKEEYLSAKRGLLNDREKELNKREELMNKRASLLSARESEYTEKEEAMENKSRELAELEKRLEKQQQSTVPDVSEFMKKVSSLANQFKAKASRSRRNSSEERQVVGASPTPPGSDNEEDKNKEPVPKTGDDSRTPSRSPSPMRRSNEPSPSNEVRRVLFSTE